VGPGLPLEGTVELPIAKDPTHPSRYRAGLHLQGRSAWTRFECLYRGDDFSVVRLLPKTGRTHQLRVHLAALGASIVGDALYGGRAVVSGLTAPRCLLHAFELELPHPEQVQRLSVRASLPEDFQLFWERAGL
jgi:23S rRNA pseudouridine1911/1915/1917 synthase